MNRNSSTLRLSIGLAFLSITVVLAAQSLGLIPNEAAAVMEGRAALCESIAVDCSLFASAGNRRAMEASLRANLERNSQIVAIAVVRANGKPIVNLNRQSEEVAATVKDVSKLQVPIMAGNKLWGTVELTFGPLRTPGWRGILGHPLTKLTLFVALASLLVDFVYLRRLLEQLDPSKVVPDRVRTTLDTLAEGLIVMDKEERIVLANESFAKTVGRSALELQGRRVTDLAWTHGDQNDSEAGEPYPWRQALANGECRTGAVLGLKDENAVHRKFNVNSSPILGDDGDYRGALASFDDVTSIESNRQELRVMLEKLKYSRDEIQRKNEQLQLLATRDPLTSCFNRRSFFEHFEVQWSNAQRHGHSLSCVMVDIDHFKAINDQHGHSVGDQVLQKVAHVLQTTVRDGDVVCRYGGEEFCIILPHLDTDQACLAAERYRQAIESTQTMHVTVTASLGVAATGHGTADTHALIDQADKCLYVAKRNGRNQIARWDEVQHNPELTAAESHDEADAAIDGGPAVPFHAVTALVSALAYRDSGTAEHSRRVADLCVAAARPYMSVSESYILETAALLHDIGKIGVPDHVLLKPGPLTDEEWKLMSVHDRIGVEIIKSSFACDQMTAIIENHHAWFEGNPRSPELPTGTDIPLGARLLSIADAFDAMVSDRVYRKGRSYEEAFVELRRCAGVQFDPELVESFIESVLARDESRRTGVPRVPKQTALQIGLQIESIASAVDNKNISELVLRANRLRVMADEYGVPLIADAAEQLQQGASSDTCDELTLLQRTSELLELCRSTQMAYLSDEVVESSGEIQDADELACSS